MVRWQTPPARRFPGSVRRPRLLECHGRLGLARAEQAQGSVGTARVVFLAIHRPGTDEKTIRRVLLANQSSLVYAIDRDRGAGELDIGGVTADRYGVRVNTSLFLIDREGKIALRPQDPGLGLKFQALMKAAGVGPGPRGMTEGQFQVLLEKLYTKEIEDLLKAPDRGAARP